MRLLMNLDWESLHNTFSTSLINFIVCSLSLMHEDEIMNNKGSINDCKAILHVVAFQASQPVAALAPQSSLVISRSPRS